MIKIFGYSDDLVEIEGASYKTSEVDCFNKDVVISFTDGTIIRIGYAKPGLGIWYIIIEKKGTAIQKLEVCEDQDSGAYSDIFYIDAEIVSHYLDEQKGKEMWLHQNTSSGQPEIIIYNKLVRDRIPEIIEVSGDTCNIEILSEERYLKMLNTKLDEEFKEYQKDSAIEELVDIIEVIYAIAVARGYTVEELENIRANKAFDRGSFENRVLLKTVTKGEK